MKKAMACRKRPCRICRRWFSPDSRLKDRQRTCGEQACKREWHRRKCAEWNRENSAFIKRERFTHRLKTVAAGSVQAKVTDEAHTSAAPLQNTPRGELLLPLAQEVIAAQLAVMIEYLLRHLVKRAQEVMGRQVTVNTG
jgi:hypothetical protein